MMPMDQLNFPHYHLQVYYFKSMIDNYNVKLKIMSKYNRFL